MRTENSNASPVEDQPSSQASSCQAESTPHWDSNPQLRHSQSVIFEFDPLFDFVDNLPKPPERVDSISGETRVSC